jgi:hypothetical protein
MAVSDEGCDFPERPRDRSHGEVMESVFRTDPGYAVELLMEVLRDGDSAEINLLLCKIYSAFSRCIE